MPKRNLLLSLAFCAFGAPAFAGPVSDFETSFDEMYATYRTALFATNSGNAEKSAQAVQGLGQQWQSLMATYGQAPPPQYADDALWPAMGAEVSDTVAKAQAEVAAGDLAASHLTLEAVREAFSALHARNGIERFSDRMNAYHAAMENILDLDLTTMDEAAKQALLEHAAVLDYLAKDVLSDPPANATDNPDYAVLSAAMRGSTDALLAAARAGDEAGLRAAVAGLKVPYSKFFLKFG
jgi:hypothetical protein